MEHIRAQRVITLAIPESEQGRPLPEHRIPTRKRLVVGPDIVEKVIVPGESRGIVRGIARVAEALNEIPRLLRKHVGRILGPYFFERARSIAQPGAREQSHDDRYE